MARSVRGSVSDTLCMRLYLWHALYVARSVSGSVWHAKHVALFSVRFLRDYLWHALCVALSVPGSV